MAISDLKLSHKEKQYKPVQNHHGETRTVYGPIISKAEIATAQRSISGSIRPDHHYPEAVEAGTALITILSYELLEINQEGTIQNQQYATMQTAWAGTVYSGRATDTSWPLRKCVQPNAYPHETHRPNFPRTATDTSWPASQDVADTLWRATSHLKSPTQIPP
jgi:hypothetical protein